MSSTARIALEPAWVLHHHPYRDTSLLLEVFSRGHGRLGLVARGARAAKSHWRGRLQRFTPLLLSWNMRAELGTLTGLETRGLPGVHSGRQLMGASYLNELIMRMLTRHDPHPGLFDAYGQALGSLGHDEERALRLFEKRLLQELGYGLLLDREADTGRPVVADRVYEYRLESGPLRCDGGYGDRLTIRGSSLLALAAERLDDPLACRECRGLLRAALSPYLGSRPLRTRDVAREFTALGLSGLLGAAGEHG
jgi:DNA repair protein RecO (recombination protein O)